jgi:hypothetical protein
VGLALHWKWATGMLSYPLLSSLTVRFIADIHHSRTVSINNNDGSYETVANILGSEPYVSLVQELTQPANFTPDGKRIREDMSWQAWTLWRAKRRLNKMRGRPSTAQVAVLSDMVSQLREAAQAKLDGRVEAAVLRQVWG